MTALYRLDRKNKKSNHALPPVLLALLVGLISAAARADATPFDLVPEMEAPPGIVASSRTVRAELAGEPEGERGLRALRAYVKEHWPQVAAVDVLALSRYHVEATRGWQPPEQPGELSGRVIGREGDHRFLELRGPRLPASFEIVHRHLTVYARYDAATDTLDRIALSIRLEIFE